jgi:hypothetical protein
MKSAIVNTQSINRAQCPVSNVLPPTPTSSLADPGPLDSSISLPLSLCSPCGDVVKEGAEWRGHHMSHHRAVALFQDGSHTHGEPGATLG